MSADNYYLIWNDDANIYVNCMFASDDDPKPDSAYAKVFPLTVEGLNDAQRFAHEEYSEYGVSDMTDLRRAWITRQLDIIYTALDSSEIDHKHGVVIEEAVNVLRTLI